MPPISSIFSRNAHTAPVSSIQNMSGRPPAVSSALGTERAEASTSVFHGAMQAQRGSTSIFHPDGYGQQASASVFHEAPSSDTADDRMRDQILEDNRYRHMRTQMRERQLNAMTKEQRVFAQSGTGKAFGSTKKFVKRLNTLIRSTPAKYKNLDKQDREYFVNMVKKQAQNLTTGAGFDLKTRKKLKDQVFKDKTAHRVSASDAKDFKSLIDQLPRS